RVDAAQLGEVGGLPDVAVHEGHTGLTQTRQGQLGASALQGVERDELPCRMALREGDAQIRARETGLSRRQNALSVFATRGPPGQAAPCGRFKAAVGTSGPPGRVIIPRPGEDSEP